ncbi:MAG TPA: hypothetical protein VJX30_03005 [Terriglobales bacterium]|jgi:hypothetical protein|nr:hypothetical protein [Terriglobales bacterium]
MALANPIPGVQGARIALGPGVWQDTFVIAPGTNDYVTGGYSISSLALRLNPTYGIQSAWISGCNATAQAYIVYPTLAIAQIGGVTTGAGFEGYSTILFYVVVLSTQAQVASGGNLSGTSWLLTVQGQ